MLTNKTQYICLTNQLECIIIARSCAIIHTWEFVMYFSFAMLHFDSKIHFQFNYLSAVEAFIRPVLVEVITWCCLLPVQFSSAWFGCILTVEQVGVKHSSTFDKPDETLVRSETRLLYAETSQGHYLMVSLIVDIARSVAMYFSFAW